MTERERNLIKSNLKAFVHTFGTARIEKENCGKGFYVFIQRIVIHISIIAIALSLSMVGFMDVFKEN